MAQDALMVDIETLGTTHDASIVTIGACMFDPRAGADQEIDDTFLVRISLESNEAAGRRIQAGTVMWWLQQSPEAQAGLFEGEITNLKQALIRFRHWFQHETRFRPETCWANDPDFDVVILKSACESVGEMWPVGFWANRSVRTVGDLAYPNHKERKVVMNTFREHVGTHHRADDDAIAQAMFVAHCIEELHK